MREHIYRAWDEETKTMYEENELEEALGENKLVATLSYGKLVIGAYDKHGEWRELKGMQYTGLKDRNGREIFEGDIVNVVALPVSPLKENMIVQYDNETGSFILKGSVFDFNLMRVNVGTVLGNVYENPELLEEEHAKN